MGVLTVHAEAGLFQPLVNRKLPRRATPASNQVIPNHPRHRSVK